MRITGGTQRGRVLSSPPDDRIRPTSDRARLAIFNMLESRGAVRGAHVLDLFCGTGALGLEALSRGAATCLFVDSAPTSLDIARKNAETLGLMPACTFRTGTAEALPPRAAAGTDAPSTLVFMDPPYHQGLVLPALSNLARGDWMAKGCFLVAETEKEWTEPFPEPYDVLSHKIYGAAGVFLLQVKS